MNIAGYFIKRPIMATVLSIMFFLSGMIALQKLPISEYPEVSPPSIVVNAQFPGANPTVIAETVASPLEEQINGVENMLYMNSLASSDGVLQLRVTFAIGTNPDLAQQLVQNRVSQVLPRLPAVTRNLGVTVTKSSPDITMVVNITSPKSSYDALYLRNYSSQNIRDELAKIKGTGDVLQFGAGDYAMRIWLNPNLVAERNLTAAEVVNAIRNQNVQAAAGVIGGAPYDDGVLVQMPVNVKGRLQTAEDFERIIIKRDDNGAITRLSDVARVEMDAQTYALRSLLNNKQSIGVAVFAAPGANALEISEAVRDTMQRLKQNMPDDVDYDIAYDPTVFVKDSIAAVIQTLMEAVALVVVVVIVFLQTWRASIIPLLAVPVSIVGTFAFMYVFGFSINVLSLFGLILSIGIVVDDAIVVVENVERNVEEGMAPREATFQAMKEVTGPIVATMLVLVGVFVPISFVSGLTGQFYLQFAMTIAIATVISTINSLTLSPAMAALLLKPKHEQTDWLSRIINVIFGRFFVAFNRMFGRGQNTYAGSVRKFAGRKAIMMTLFAGLVALTGYTFTIVPKGFVPAQDKGYLISFAQLPPGSTLDQTEAVLKEMTDIALQEDGVKDALQYPGLSVNGFVNSPASGIVFATLEDFHSRKDPSMNGFAIAKKLQQKFNGIDEAFIAIFPPPPVSGLGNTGGFKLQIEDKGDLGYEALDNVVKAVIAKAQERPELTTVYSNYNISYPQLFANVDRTKAEQLGVSVNDVFTTMQAYLGSMYVNDFNRFGRTYQVIAQADKQFRASPEDILTLQTRNMDGQMVPLGSLVTVQESNGPEIASRYNAFRSADINGDAAPGYSSGQAQDAIMEVLDEVLPQGMEYEWTELTYQQILAGNTAIYIFPLCLFLVFLVLAAQYESLTLPLAIIMIVPMAILSAMLGIFVTDGDNNIFTQIALFVLAGLATKNAILIVEFAKELEHSGHGIVKAAVEASRLRLRPILMTSFAFIMGVLPLVVSHGAGAEMRQAIGIAVFYGMLGVTFFGLVFTPVFYVLIRGIEDKLKGKPVEAA